jgi:DNA mismatch repair protein MLH3
MPARILPLSEDAISRINSSKQITSLSGVTIALLENALDADATKIDISVNFGRGSCVVEDNGTGISSLEFSEHGGLGKIHHTSKATSGQTLHGSAGTYLASLAALSMVSVTSRHSTEEVGATMIMHQGRVVARHLPSLPNHELTAFGTHGTRVSVNDLFGNMPVRVKQRALLSAQGTSTDGRTWLELKRDVLALLLAWKTPCTVKLRDSENHNRNLTLSGNHSTVSSALTERNLNTLRGDTARYDLKDAFPLLFQAGFASFNSRPRWVPVSASTSRLSCHGLVCLDPSPTRLCQFVSIGIQPCSSTSGHHTIYEAINKLFMNSDFGTVAERDSSRPDQRGIQSGDQSTYRQNRTSKGIDRWPMFILQLKLGDDSVKTAQHRPENQLEQIIDVVEAMIRRWLEHHGHRPQQKRSRKDQYLALPHTTGSSPLSTTRQELDSQHNSKDSRRGIPSRSRTSPLVDSLTAKHSVIDLREATPTLKRPRTTYDLDLMSKIKSGKYEIAPPPRTYRSPATEQSRHFTLPPLEPGSLSSRFKVTKSVKTPHLKDFVAAVSPPAGSHTATHSDDFGSISESDLLEAASAPGLGHVFAEESTHADPNLLSDQDGAVEWKDPITKQTFLVNCRTGIIIPSTDQARTSLSGMAAGRPGSALSINMATITAGRPLTINGRGTSASNDLVDHEVPTFLSNWQNPVFARQAEQEIPVASIMGPGMDLSSLGNHRCNHDAVSDYFAGSGHGVPSKLSKADLQHFTVINQVDAKFILCSLPSADTGARTLVLVDQHAASERVILESLLSDLCAPIDEISPIASFRTNLHYTSAVDTVPLELALIFEVTPAESDLLRTHAPLFARFGILYDLRAEIGGKSHHTLAARALPPAIAERCKLFPKLLIDLLRSEIWSRVDSGKKAPAVRSDVPSGEQGWIESIGSCPKALLDMVNSRACRSAVMFNDVLSILECEQLMAKLAKCAFPFMCAHGRVSMVPIGIVGGDGDSVFDDRHGKMGLSKVVVDQRPFSEAFKGWKAKS